MPITTENGQIRVVETKKALPRPIVDYDDLKDALNSVHIYKRNEIEKYTKFSRFGYFDPYSVNTTTREYVFFTKPDLHLFDGKGVLSSELKNYTFFQTAFNNYREVMEELQTTFINDGRPFVNILTNTINSKINLDDISMDNLESAANIAGTKLIYPLATTGSSNNVDFSAEFIDTKYLDVYMFFRIWYEYELLKVSGAITPPDKNYIINRIAHNLSSCYKIIVGEDGETIIHWTKFWGIYPTSIPRGTLSEIPDGKVTMPVSFKAQWVEDMDGAILTDFNKLTAYISTDETKDIPIYNTAENMNMVDGRWCSRPYIIASRSSIDNRKVYKLKWR